MRSSPYGMLPPSRTRPRANHSNHRRPRLARPATRGHDDSLPAPTSSGARAVPLRSFHDPSARRRRARNLSRGPRWPRRSAGHGFGPVGTGGRRREGLLFDRHEPGRPARHGEADYRSRARPADPGRSRRGARAHPGRRATGGRDPRSHDAQGAPGEGGLEREGRGGSIPRQRSQQEGSAQDRVGAHLHRAQGRQRAHRRRQPTRSASTITAPCATAPSSTARSTAAHQRSFRSTA